MLKKFFHSYPAILNQQIQQSFSERMEKAMEERIDDLKTRKQDRFNAKKEKYDGRSKRRKWEHDESEEAKRLRLEESGGERIKRRKALVLLGYSGVNYCGMQRNLGIETIEEELLKAMLKHKWINDLGKLCCLWINMILIESIQAFRHHNSFNFNVLLELTKEYLLVVKLFP